MDRNNRSGKPHTGGSRRLDEGTCAALEMLESRWALRLLTALVAGPARFSELEAAGLVGRTVEPGPPITSTYGLTADGEGLGEILELVRRWAASRPDLAAS